MPFLALGCALAFCLEVSISCGLVYPMGLALLASMFVLVFVHACLPPGPTGLRVTAAYGPGLPYNIRNVKMSGQPFDNNHSTTTIRQQLRVRKREATERSCSTRGRF
jgi:hypothetical protein